MHTGTARQRSRSAGSVVRGAWTAAYLAGPYNAPPQSPSSQGRPTGETRQPIFTIDEMNCLDELRVGGPSGSVRLEHLGRVSGPCVPADSADDAEETAQKRARGSRYLTPYALRDPVAVCINGGVLLVKRYDANGELAHPAICSAELRNLCKISLSITGIVIAEASGLSLALSVHDETRRLALYKLLHARARGAPPPTEQRAPSKPIVPNRSLSRQRSSEDHPTPPKQSIVVSAPPSFHISTAPHQRSRPKSVEQRAPRDDRADRRERLLAQLKAVQRRGTRPSSTSLHKDRSCTTGEN